jgi:uncharacterized membrane protein YsdA (DUF1294 family)
MASGGSEASRQRRDRRPLLGRPGFALWILIAALSLVGVAAFALHVRGTRLFLVHLGLLSAAEFLIVAADKLRARGEGSRVSEFNLLLLAALGGAAGGLLGIHLLRHKTQRRLFTIGLPVLLFVHFVVLMLLLFAH